MPVYQCKDIPLDITEITQNRDYQVYLVHGERYLCQEVARDIIAALLPNEKTHDFNLKKINGENEDLSQTANLLKSHSLFPGLQVIRVTDSKLFFSKTVAKTFWDKAKKARQDNKTEKARQYLAKMYGIGGLEADDMLADISATQWKKIFGFAKPADTAWAQEIPLPEQITANPEGSGAELFSEIIQKTIPTNNILLLIAEAVDKRKKLYKLISKIGVIFDLSIDAGATQAARAAQDATIKDLILKTLKDMGKKSSPEIIKMLLDRVGFHPVAAVREAEKLALFCNDSDTITPADVNAIVGRTREEAIYELNEAVASRNLQQALLLSSRIREGGIHPLALLASLRNVIRKLLFFRSIQLQREPAYIPGQSYGAFQKGYLVALKESRHKDSSFLAAHPFVLYKSLQQAEKFEMRALKHGLAELLNVESRLKGGGISDAMALDNFFFSFLGGQDLL
jgi:DNA polymerase-3 subunit delta